METQGVFMKLTKILVIILCLTFSLIKSMEENQEKYMEEGFIKACGELFRCFDEKAIDEAKQFIDENIHLINAEDSAGRTALSLAIFYNNSEIVKYLLDKGAKINENESSSSLLSAILEYVLKKEKKIEIAEALLLNGANPNVFDRWGNSILSNCLVGHHIEDMCKMIELLVQYGADVNLEFGLEETGHIGLYYLYTFNKGKIRPLQYAKKYKLPKAIKKCLRKNGAK